MNIIIYILAGIGTLTVLSVFVLLALWRYAARKEKKLDRDSCPEN